MVWLPHYYLEKCEGNTCVLIWFTVRKFIDENDENFVQCSRSESQRLNLEPPEYWFWNVPSPLCVVINR
jgi:hypothetical protein